MSKLSTQRQACSEFLFAHKLKHSNLERTCLSFCGVDPTFHHKIFTADHPLHQMAYFRVVWSCCNKQIWLQKKSSEKWSAWWCGSTCFPIERHQIRVCAVKVSFDPRQIAHTVTYKDMSTSSCSLQYQLSFKARMVSVGWVVSEWQDSECKKGTFSGIFSVNPLWKSAIFYRSTTFEPFGVAIVLLGSVNYKQCSITQIFVYLAWRRKSAWLSFIIPLSVPFQRNRLRLGPPGKAL
jgi:hypothetical protein